uniref:Uncharacterized protein n=1 Tax=Rhizophora mucronata TaxID=61149 RepID=A0A2P2IJ83_RHIMU
MIKHFKQQRYVKSQTPTARHFQYSSRSSIRITKVKLNHCQSDRGST